MKNTQYNAHLWLNRRKFRVLKEIGVEEHDGDVRFRPEVEIRPFGSCAMKKICNITLIYGQMAEIPAS